MNFGQQENFYQFANGGWLKKPLPADKPMIGAFQEVDERNQALLHQIAEKAARNSATPAGSVERKIGDFYRTGMDEALADKLGAKPLQPLFDQVSAVSDSASLLTEIARLHRMGIPAAFSFEVGQDDRDSATIILQVGQGGIGLPTRDYYFDKDTKSEAIRKQYQAHITNVFGLLGDKPEDAAKEAADAFALETRLAGASLAPTQLRDPVANYHKMTLAELNAAAPGADWNGYFTALGKPEPGSILVGQPAFMTELGKALNDAPLPQWKTYLRWKVASGMSSYLSRPFLDENFRFSANFTGQKTMTPRWKRVLRTTDSALGEAMGQLFVAKTFPPEAKQRAMELVLNLKAALRERVQALDWMGTATKSEALRKLDSLMIKIGYPDKWRDYSALQVGTDSYVQNVLRVTDFAFQYQLNKTRQAGGPDGMEHDAADRKRLLQPADERNRVSRRNFAAAVLRREGGRRQQLRRDWSGHRTRNDARLRRSGAAVRRGGQPARLVDGGGRRPLQRALAGARQAVRELRRGG